MLTIRSLETLRATAGQSVIIIMWQSASSFIALNSFIIVLLPIQFPIRVYVPYGRVCTEIPINSHKTDAVWKILSTYTFSVVMLIVMMAIWITLVCVYATRVRMCSPAARWLASDNVLQGLGWRWRLSRLLYQALKHTLIDLCLSIGCAHTMELIIVAIAHSGILDAIHMFISKYTYLNREIRPRVAFVRCYFCDNVRLIARSPDIFTPVLIENKALIAYICIR